VPIVAAVGRLRQENLFSPEFENRQGQRSEISEVEEIEKEELTSRISAALPLSIVGKLSNNSPTGSLQVHVF
jgi:hypothetical protein